MPETYSVKDVQSSYKAIFDRAKKTKKPIIILKNNKPEVAVLDYEEMEKLQEKLKNFEYQDALDSVKIYKKEKKAGKLRRLSSLDELFNN